MYKSSDNIAQLEKKAANLEANGNVVDALSIRERLLVLTQRLHGDKSQEADIQKFKFGALTLRWALERGTTERSQQRQSSADASHVAGAAASLRQRKSQSLTKPERPPTPSAANKRHANCAHDDSSSAPSRLPDRGGANQDLFAGLSVASCVALAESLLSEEHIGPSLMHDASTAELRGRLLLTQVSHFHHAHRPRAALPVLHKAIAQLTTAARLAVPGEEPCSVELAEAHLTLCVLNSAANHHREALAAAHFALGITLMVEERRWRSDPLMQQERRPADARPASGKPPRADASAAADQSPTSKSLAARRPTSAARERPLSADSAAEPLPTRTTIYCGALQAACYHNIGVEQEHLGLGELALESFQTGFELAFLTLGEADPLTQRMKQCYAELFASINCRHFGSAEAAQKTAVQRVMNDPHRALARLRESYERSVKHNKTLQSEVQRQQRILDAPAALEASHSRSHVSRPSSAVSRARPQSAQSRR